MAFEGVRNETGEAKSRVCGPGQARCWTRACRSKATSAVKRETGISDKTKSLSPHFLRAVWCCGVWCECSTLRGTYKTGGPLIPAVAGRRTGTDDGTETGEWEWKQ